MPKAKFNHMALDKNVSCTHFVTAEARRWIKYRQRSQNGGKQLPHNSKNPTHFNAVMKHLPHRRDMITIFIPLTNENFIHKEIKNRLNLGNACYHSV
jgi:hypothetical protein